MSDGPQVEQFTTVGELMKYLRQFKLDDSVMMADATNKGNGYIKLQTAVDAQCLNENNELVDAGLGSHFLFVNARPEGSDFNLLLEVEKMLG